MESLFAIFEQTVSIKRAFIAEKYKVMPSEESIRKVYEYRETMKCQVYDEIIVNSFFLKRCYRFKNLGINIFGRRI